MSQYEIPLYQPELGGNERKYVLECLDSTWISSRGRFVNEFEVRFAERIRVDHAASVCNGTAALHVALMALGIGPGDEVIVPTLTYIASVNAIAYTGATPVFVDSLRSTWQVDPEDVRRRITARTRAIMAVHLYGQACDMDAIVAIAEEHRLFVVEDCAEAFGSLYGGRHVGTFGDIAAFSFFGNKTITTGEGGMVVSNDKTLIERARHLKGQGLAAHREYWHDVVGYNYRMTNIEAAIGLAQLERADQLIERKRDLAARYAAALAHLPIDIHSQAGPIAQAGRTIRVHEIDSGSAAIRNAFRQLELDILLPSFDVLTFGAEIPWLGYLYDMQHKYLPNFFSPRELKRRDSDMERMLRDASAVIVNSRALKSDTRSYFPAASAQIVALPFSAAPLPVWFELSPDAVRAKYSVGPRYFIVCNQFWKHKDHATAFRAFADLASVHPELQLVCTGAISDYRDRHYFTSLQELLSELGIEDRVFILGRIPKPDQIALLRGSVALIQPTMFEGGPGGGAGYDAVALGVPCILSDIPVNLEIDESGVRFFTSRDSASLRKAMALSHAEADTLVPVPPAELLARGWARRKACGNVLVQAAMMAIESVAADH